MTSWASTGTSTSTKVAGASATKRCRATSTRRGASAGEELAIEATREVLALAGSDAGHIFNLGHGVLPATDPDVLAAVVKVVHEEGKAGVR